MQRFLAIIVFALLLCCSQVQAQENAEQPIMGSQSIEELIQQTVEDTHRVLVIGDALAGGLGAGLARMAEADPKFEIINRYQETSGIARPQVYDWAASLPIMMEGKNFNSVVVLMGANDRQSIRVGEAKHEFNSPEWLAAYKTRTAQLLDILKASGAKIFWVAIPPMGDALYDRDMQILASLQKAEALSKGAVYVDLRANFTNPDGTYTDTGPDDTGEVRKLRGRDGVEFLRQGNNRFGQLLFAEINREIANTPQQASPATLAPKDLTPIFGQLTIDGIDATIQPDIAKIAEATRVQAMIASNGKITRTDIVPGSSAEKLFVQGEAPPAPAGRFDDFTMVTPAE